MYSKRTFRDKEYYWPENDNTGWSAISGTWFQVDRVLTRFNNRKLCLQAGGNNGLYPVILSQHFDQVITFEPGPKMFECLMLNLELHDVKNVTAYQSALSDTVEPLSLNVVTEDNLGASYMLSRNINQYPINTVDNIASCRIDDLQLDACDFLFLDVEGYEQFALLSGIETIQKYKPVIMLELNNACTAYGYTNGEIEDWVLQQGYKLDLVFRDDKLFLPI